MANIPISPSSYDIGDTVHGTVTFKTTVNGVKTPTDPTVVSFKTKDPSGTVVTKVYSTDVEVVKDSTGVYHCDFNLPTVGTWFYRWAGTGVASGAAERQLQVRKSAF